MSEITPTNGDIETVEKTSSPEAVPRKGEEKPPAWVSRTEKIREELGIVDGQVALTFLDDGI